MKLFPLAYMNNAWTFVTKSMNGKVIIHTTLYGPVSRERNEHERRLAEHRAEQLS